MPVGLFLEHIKGLRAVQDPELNDLTDPVDQPVQQRPGQTLQGALAEVGLPAVLNDPECRLGGLTRHGDTHFGAVGRPYGAFDAHRHDGSYAVCLHRG